MNANRFVARIVSCSLVALSIFLALALTRRTNADVHSAVDLAQIAPTPPMGWNSWDAYGEAVPNLTSALPPTSWPQI